VRALIIGIYYVVPVRAGGDEAQVILRGVATFVGGVLVTWLVLRQVAHQIADPEHAPLTRLFTALVGGVTFFALVDYVIAVSQSDQFVGLRTKTDGRLSRRDDRLRGKPAADRVAGHRAGVKHHGQGAVHVTRAVDGLGQGIPAQLGDGRAASGEPAQEPPA
jgi:hypothetical protein